MQVALPAITSTSAGALPLYGTCSMGAPVRPLSSSPDRWLVAPVPPEAKLTLSGLALA